MHGMITSEPTIGVMMTFDNTTDESHGDILFDGYGIPGELLIRVLLELGLDDNGLPADDSKDYRTMKRTDRGVKFVDDAGRTLMITRSYWWGDCDTAEDQAAADLPNLEIPPLGIVISWYKYAFRDSTANVVIDAPMVERIRNLMKPCLDEIHDDVEHPYDVDITWTDPLTAVVDGGEYKNVAINGDGDIRISTADGFMNLLGHEDSLDDAHEWVRLVTAQWR